MSSLEILSSLYTSSMCVRGKTISLTYRVGKLRQAIPSKPTCFIPYLPLSNYLLCVCVVYFCCFWISAVQKEKSIGHCIWPLVLVEVQWKTPCLLLPMVHSAKALDDQRIAFWVRLPGWVPPCPLTGHTTRLLCLLCCGNRRTFPGFDVGDTLRIRKVAPEDSQVLAPTPEFITEAGSWNRNMYSFSEITCWYVCCLAKHIRVRAKVTCQIKNSTASMLSVHKMYSSTQVSSRLVLISLNWTNRPYLAH